MAKRKLMFWTGFILALLLLSLGVGVGCAPKSPPPSPPAPSPPSPTPSPPTPPTTPSAAPGAYIKLKVIVTTEPMLHPPGTYKVTPAGMGNEFSITGSIQEILAMPPQSECHDWGPRWSITIIYYGAQCLCRSQDLIEVQGFCGIVPDKPWFHPLVVIPDKGCYIKRITR